MKHAVRFTIAIALFGSALLVANLLRPEPRTRPFSVRSAEADRFSTDSDSGYRILLHIAPTAGDSAEGIALIKRGIKLQADGQHAEAIKAFDSAASHLPQIADWLTVFAATSASHLGDTLEVKRRLGSVDDVMAAQWAWRTRVRAYELAKAPERALAVAQQATKSGRSIKRADAWLRVAELQQDKGDSTASRAALLEAMRAAPGSESGADAARALAKLPDLSGDEALETGRTLMRNGEVTAGVRVIDAAVADKRVTGAAAATASYEAGRALFSVAKYDAAATHLRAVPATHERAADALFMLARTRYRAGDKTASRSTFKQVAEKYPQSAAATRALFFLADITHDDGDVEAAAELFERTAAAPARADESALSRMRRGGIAFAQGDIAGAQRIFDDFRTQYPEGAYRAQATYWAALTRMKLGNKTEANTLLRTVRRTAPLSYYGMRAAELLDLPPAIDVIPEGPAVDEKPIAEVRAGVARWALLREVGWNEAAAFELRRLQQHFDRNIAARYAIAEELQRRDGAHLAIAIGRAILSEGTPWNRRLLRIMYPMPYQQLIEREARKYDIDPFFVAALIRQESQFNHAAVSGAGAIGLMQVMPATGKELGKATRNPKVTRDRLKEPELNVQLGTRFLADLMQMYRDRTDVVLVAYNAGPTRAYRWRSFPEFGTEDLFIERIPFDETREYVKVVKANAAIYRALYSGTDTAD